MKRLIRAAIHNSGALSLWRAFHADRLRILMYHNFPDRAAGLERTCEEIRRHYTPVSMPQVAASLATGEPLPQNAVAVTIDDGYRDFLDAYSIFEKFGIPATVYLISDFLDRGSWLWWNRIDWALRHTHRRGGFSLTIGGGSRAYSLDGNRVAIAGSVCEDLKRCANSERLRAIEELIETLGVTMPTELPAEWRPLTWEEVRALSRRGVEFGAHTRTHPILGRIEDVREMRAEIEISKRRVEEELNRRRLTLPIRTGSREILPGRRCAR